jgi:hypothetical protein
MQQLCRRLGDNGGSAPVPDVKVAIFAKNAPISIFHYVARKLKWILALW